MTDLKENIIKKSGIHPSRIFNIILFGSRIYGTNTPTSDFDVIIVANNSIESKEIRNGLFNIHVYTPNKFQNDLDWHMPKNLECYFAPEWAILKNDIEFKFKLDLSKLRHATSHVSSNSWVKCKKKIIDNEYNIAIKSLFHSMRIPLFSTQIAKTGKIEDFECANWIWDIINFKNKSEYMKDKYRWTWEDIEHEFREPRNRILTEFRKYAIK